MKVPSLFRLPKYQRFEIQPRHYDPVKEDIENRTARIKQELRLAREGKEVESIRDAFKTRRNSNKSADLFQLLMIVIIAVSVGGYIFWGANVYFALLLLVPLYIILRRKKS
ncbi:MAG: hypothetical protein ACJAT1_000199 [Marivirga sp.]|jgi:hypothetical protein